jgi:hypothetical protein
LFFIERIVEVAQLFPTLMVTPVKIAVDPAAFLMIFFALPPLGYALKLPGFRGHFPLCGEGSTNGQETSSCLSLGVPG